jgi:hypothetical protein
MDSIKIHIEKDRRILEDPLVSSQSRRHIEEELKQLERYAANHPEDYHDPSPLELFCDENPSAPECKIHDN